MLFFCLLLNFAPRSSFSAEGLSRRERIQAAAQAKELMKGKKFKEAAASFEKAVSPGAGKGDLFQWLPDLGRCYEILKDYHKALSEYQRVHQLQPKGTEPALNLARLYSLVQLDAPAVDIYQKVLKRDKSRKDVALPLAALYLRQGRLKDARQQADNSLRWEPRDLPAQRLMAKIEEASGDLASAAHRWELILAQEPSPQGYFDLAQRWSRLGEYDLAQGAFQKAETGGLRTGSFFLQRGVVAWQRGDDQAATTLWSHALEEDPSLTLADFFLALADWQANRADAAVERMGRVEAKTSSDTLRGLARDFLIGRQ
jgi:tetratricopeptide (TPR) repeat protein